MTMQEVPGSKQLCIGAQCHVECRNFSPNIQKTSFSYSFTTQLSVTDKILEKLKKRQQRCKVLGSLEQHREQIFRKL